MTIARDPHRGSTVTFLPHRLNRQPVIVRGLTADELWITAGASALAGLLLGTALAMLAGSIALAPTITVIAVAIGVGAGGTILRRMKRGRPDTWLHRELQWWVAQHAPWMACYFGGEALVTRSGHWTTHRSAHR